jgi:molecular chaperone HscB
MSAVLSSSHFELFGLPLSFDVDREQLDNRYRALQRTVHPDRFVNATGRERRLSMQQATRINEGYQILKDPLRRGRYLLELGGYAFDDERHTLSDPGFLMEQMELREALGDIRTASDPLAALGKVADRIDTDFASLTGELKARLENSGPDEQDAVAETLKKMQFFRRLQEEALELEATLEDELLQ